MVLYFRNIYLFQPWGKNSCVSQGNGGADTVTTDLLADEQNFVKYFRTFRCENFQLSPFTKTIEPHVCHP